MEGFLEATGAATTVSTFNHILREKAQASAVGAAKVIRGDHLMLTTLSTIATQVITHIPVIYLRIDFSVAILAQVGTPGLRSVLLFGPRVLTYGMVRPCPACAAQGILRSCQSTGASDAHGEAAARRRPPIPDSCYGGKKWSAQNGVGWHCPSCKTYNFGFRALCYGCKVVARPGGLVPPAGNGKKPVPSHLSKPWEGLEHQLAAEKDPEI
eukprot:1666459-Amphidinium_carterae.1